MAHLAGQSRDQLSLFPTTLNEAVSADHPIRVIDAFVDGLDLAGMGFSKVVAEEMGRPPYAPGDLLKLYVYGYMNRVRSSRGLEREAERNVEVMWLIHGLTPAFKTIADFRKDHPKAIVEVCRDFIRFCRELSLVGGELLAIDGTKIEAVASHKQVVTPKGLEKTIAALDRKIAAHLAAMDQADREEATDGTAAMDKAAVAKALQQLREKREKARQHADRLAAEGLSQLVLTERDAKLMRTARHGHQVAYNAQTAVDAEHKLIIAFDLTNDGNDQRQLHPMAMQGKQAVEVEQVTVVADAGYSNGEHGRRCEENGITAIVPRAETVNPEGKQYFSRDRFTYEPASDTWQCPAGETLTFREVSQTEQKKKYWSTACGDCRLKPHCTKAAKRMIVRHFYEDDREAMHQRAMSDPAWMKHRREMAEHPYGTIKWLMGYPRFLLRGLQKANAELALTIVGYNLKRVISILGVAVMLEALQPLRN
ncbi:MAG: IS1182 family transposase [Bradyrhizobium sp.]|nr:IS1182 family transposase [Bradyrhizobium sp.]